MSYKNKTVFHESSQLTRSLLVSLLEKGVKFILIKNGNLYEILSEKEVKKVTITENFTFKDVLTGKSYTVKVDKCESSSSTSTSTSSTSESCNSETLFAVAVYDGTPGTGSTIVSGPVLMKKGDSLNFWSTGGILNIATEGSVDLQTEVRNQLILPRPPNPAVDFVGWQSDAIYYDSLNKVLYLYSAATGG